jgi:hypothetical protein
MELTGEEKRIQALFLEQKREDESGTPRFATTWNRAQAQTAVRRRPLGFSFVAAAAAVACVAIFSLALLVAHWRGSQNSTLGAVKQPATLNNSPTPVRKNPEPENLVVVEPQHHPSRKPRSAKLSARQTELLVARQSARREARAAMRDAVAISSWKSPTSTFLSSPGDEVLTSLPQLNQTVNELKSFLPSRNN